MNTLIHNNENVKRARRFHCRGMVTAPRCNTMPLLEKVSLKTVERAGCVYRVTPKQKRETRTAKQRDQMVGIGYSHITYVLISKGWEEERNPQNTDGVMGNPKHFSVPVAILVRFQMFKKRKRRGFALNNTQGRLEKPSLPRLCNLAGPL